MKNDERTFNLDELSRLSEMPRRTIRYYIQIGLLDKPTGVGRGSHYTTQHLHQLLEIRTWQQAGLSLERIQHLRRARDAGDDLAPLEPPRKAGTIEVWSHLVLDEGVELMIEPARCGLTSEQIAALTEAIVVQLRQIRALQGEDT